jgi:hypothetical protein
MRLVCVGEAGAPVATFKYRHPPQRPSNSFSMAEIAVQDALIKACLSGKAASPELARNEAFRTWAAKVHRMKSGKTLPRK